MNRKQQHGIKTGRFFVLPITSRGRYPCATSDNHPCQWQCPSKGRFLTACTTETECYGVTTRTVSIQLSANVLNVSDAVLAFTQVMAFPILIEILVVCFNRNLKVLMSLVPQCRYEDALLVAHWSVGLVAASRPRAHLRIKIRRVRANARLIVSMAPP